MSIRQRVTDKATSFKGQKSALPIESYGIQNAEQIKNFYLHHGQLNKSNGSALYTEVTSGTGPVVSLHAMKDILVIQRGTGVAIKVFTDESITPNPIDVITLASEQRLVSCFWRNRMYFSNRRDCFFFSYQETGVGFLAQQQLIGLDPPATGLTAAWISAGAAGNVANGDYYYMVALYDQNTNTESPCGGALPTQDGLYELSPNGFLGPRPAAFTMAGGPKKVNIDGAQLRDYLAAANALSGSRATHFVLYRSGAKVGGLYDSFFRVPLKDGGTYDGSVLIPISYFDFPATFVDNTATGDLPAVSPPENNSPPPTPVRLKASLTAAQASYGAGETWALSDYSGFRHMRFFRDQLFGIGARSYGYTVTQNIAFGTDVTQKVTGKITDFRDLLHGSEVYQPDYWPYRWEIGRGDGQEAIGLGVLGDAALLVFKESSAYYLSGSSADEYVVRVMDTQRGAINEGTIQETPKGVITLDRSGFVLWNKIGQGLPISDDIHDQIENIEFVYASKFYSSYDSKLKIYRCSVVTPGSTNPNYTFVLDLDAMEWSYEKGGEGLSRIQFSVNSNNISTYAGFAVDTGRVYDYVGSASNGKVFDLSDSQNVTYNGSAIEGMWTSGTINFGDDQHKKRMKWIYLRAKSFGGWKVDIEVIPDYDESRKFVLQNWDVASSQSLWYSSDIATDGSLLWSSSDSASDGGRWASEGQTRDVSKIPVSCIGYSFQIRIIHKEINDSRYGFAIESVSAEGVQLGR